MLNLSGWYDEGYGPEGAATNFNGLVEARGGSGQARTHLILGPWIHGVGSTGERRVGELDFGPAAAIDYDDVVLDFFDHYLRGVRQRLCNGPGGTPLRDGRQRMADRLELAACEHAGPCRSTSTVPTTAGAFCDSRRLRGAPSQATFVADPLEPVVDPYGEYGPHDYRQLEARKDVLTFDTEPLAEDLQVSGPISAVIHASCDCRDFDLWVRLQDVYPDGRAMNLMSPGNDVVRASYRDAGDGRAAARAGQDL